MDAEEERLEREVERANQEHRPLEVSRRRQLPQDNDENQNQNEMLNHYEENCMIPLEIYVVFIAIGDLIVIQTDGPVISME